DARTLLELLGNGLEVAHQEPGAEGDQEGRVGEDQCPRGVAELEVPDDVGERDEQERGRHEIGDEDRRAERAGHRELQAGERVPGQEPAEERDERDRKSTRLNSSHGSISYAVFCLKKKITLV